LVSHGWCAGFGLFFMVSGFLELFRAFLELFQRFFNTLNPLGTFNAFSTFFTKQI